MRNAAAWLLSAALVLTLCAALYALCAVRASFSPAVSAEAVAYHYRRETALSGVVLRCERLLPAQGGKILLLCPDGRRVAAGESLGVAADSGEGFLRARLLLRLEAELPDAEGAYPLPDAALARSCARLRRAAARRDHDEAAEAAERLALGLFPRPDAAATLRSEIEALRSLGGGEAILRAPESGYFLRCTDGWEGVSDITDPAALDVMCTRGAEPTAALGRLVTGSRWRLASVTDGATAALFLPGERVTLMIGGERFDAEVASRFSDGRREGVTFLGRSGLEKLLTTRFTTFTAVLSECDGLLLPAAALREENGETVVYRLAGRFARRERVTVLARPEGGVLVECAALRPGSRVLLSGDWADGEIVRQPLRPGVPTSPFG